MNETLLDNDNTETAHRNGPTEVTLSKHFTRNFNCSMQFKERVIYRLKQKIKPLTMLSLDT